jgi:ribonucleoside-diphosphate reductase alpha chain
LSIQSKLANTDFEPLGVGITNLAYWHARKGFKYGDAEALAEVKRWMEHQAYFLTETSVELAQEKGPCGRSQYTYYGKGVFPWERRSDGVNELTDFTPSGNLDWEGLRAKLLQYGIRNATLMAVAPVESSSVVLNSTNGIEMPMEMISVKESKAGSFVQVVPEYHRLKNKYQLMWDQQDCVAYLKTSAVLAAYIDQSLSTNTFYNPAYFAGGKVPATLIAKNLMLAYKWGIKTMYYSLINKVGSKVNVTATQSLPILNGEPIAIYTDEEDCEACKL